jgi:hypothetical protein
MSCKTLIEHCEKCLEDIKQNIAWHKEMIEGDLKQLEYWMVQKEHYKDLQREYERSKR